MHRKDTAKTHQVTPEKWLTILQGIADLELQTTELSFDLEGDNRRYEGRSWKLI